ncbi:MAG: ATP-binding protein, partial [Candidatus Paceibacterota bacterium]
TEAKKAFSTGRGIGLYLSYQIVKAHNGKLWAESEGKGKGSTFIFELPIDKEG